MMMIIITGVMGFRFVQGIIKSAVLSSDESPWDFWQRSMSKTDIVCVYDKGNDVLLTLGEIKLVMMMLLVMMVVLVMVMVVMMMMVLVMVMIMVIMLITVKMMIIVLMMVIMTVLMMVIMTVMMIVMMIVA